MSVTRSWINSIMLMPVSRSPNGIDTNPIERIELVESQVVDAGHARAARPRNHPHRRERPLWRDERDEIAEVHARAAWRGPRPMRMAGGASSLSWLSASRLPCQHRRLDRGDRRLERGIDRLHADERLRSPGGDERLAEDRRRGAHHARHLQQLGHLGRVVGDAAGLPDIDVRLRRKDLVAQLALQSGHQRQCDDERHHADGHANHRNERDQRDERLLAAREQIAEGDEELE